MPRPSSYAVFCLKKTASSSLVLVLELLQSRRETCERPFVPPERLEIALARRDPEVHQFVGRTLQQLVEIVPQLLRPAIGRLHLPPARLDLVGLVQRTG